MGSKSNPTKPQIKSNRIPGLLLRGIGVTASVAGAVAVIVGSVLPWLQVPLFGAEIAVPGLLVWGGITLALGLLTLTSLMRRRLAPPVSLIAGLLCALLGWQAQQTVGQAVKRYALETQMRLAPVNEKLDQIRMPPIEPFGDSIGLASRFVGPGPLWILYGAAGMTLGGAAQMGGMRWGRTCARCHCAWQSGRGVHFCPHCGAAAVVRHACAVCHQDLRKQDKFCVNCGASAAKQ